MSKPRAIVAVDVDEVCADMLGRLCEIVRNAFGSEVIQGTRTTLIPCFNGEPVPSGSQNILPEDISGWDLKPYFGSHWHEWLKEKDFYPKTQPMPGARRGIHTLLGCGYRVIYVTSCIPGTADAKQEWLLKWGFLTEKNAMRDFFAVSDKAMVNADVLFDDAVHNVEAFAATGRHAILVNHWHNRMTVRMLPGPSVNSLFEAPALLEKLGF